MTKQLKEMIKVIGEAMSSLVEVHGPWDGKSSLFHLPANVNVYHYLITQCEDEKMKKRKECLSGEPQSCEIDQGGNEKGEEAEGGNNSMSSNCKDRLVTLIIPDGDLFERFRLSVKGYEILCCWTSLGNTSLHVTHLPLSAFCFSPLFSHFSFHIPNSSISLIYPFIHSSISLSLYSYIPTFLHSYIPTFLHSYILPRPRILHSSTPPHSPLSPTLLFLHSLNALSFPNFPNFTNFSNLSHNSPILRFPIPQLSQFCFTTSSLFLLPSFPIPLYFLLFIFQFLLSDKGIKLRSNWLIQLSRKLHQRYNLPTNMPVFHPQLSLFSEEMIQVDRLVNIHESMSKPR